MNKTPYLGKIGLGGLLYWGHFVFGALLYRKAYCIGGHFVLRGFCIKVTFSPVSYGGFCPGAFSEGFFDRIPFITWKKFQYKRLSMKPNKKSSDTSLFPPKMILQDIHKYIDYLMGK